MEETLSVIIHGCKLARDLESNLANLSASPNVLSSSCNEIVRVFESAIHRLMILINSAEAAAVATHLPSSSSPSSSQYPSTHEILAVYGGHEPGTMTTTTTSDHHGDHPDPGVQEWLKSSYTQAIELLQAHQLLLSEHKNNPLMQQSAADHLQLERMETISTAMTSTTTNRHQLGVKNMAAREVSIGDGDGIAPRLLIRSSTRGGGGDDQYIQRDQEVGSDSGKNPVVQRSRKRKDGAGKRMVRVAGPRIAGGNMEIPPDDGFTWRKYGQKEILGSTFPRGYYRCTHRNFYGCEAKKQVQRLDDDPNTFEVTYYGHHTCHISSSSSSGAYMGGSSGINSTSGGGVGVGPVSTSSYVVRGAHDTNSGGEMILMDSTSSGTTSNTASCSSVVELVEAIFNSGMSSSSINSMDSIFPNSFHHQDK